MAKLVKKDSDGRTTYEGILTSKEIIPYDELLEFLKKKIPDIEKALEEQYGKTVLYKYYLGKALQKYLTDNDVSENERRTFWNEIKDFATQEERKRNEGVNSKTRSFYEQCFILSQIDIEAVKKLSWRQWQDLLDRIGNREDERIYKWIKKQTSKIREDDWREFEKILHFFLRGKETSVFTDNEMFNIYDSFLLAAKRWREQFNGFIEGLPNYKRFIKRHAKLIKQYIAICLQMRRENKKEIDEMICKAAFGQALKIE